MSDDNIPNGYFRDTDGMLRIKPVTPITPSPAEPLSSDDLARLEEMDAPALIALIERMARQCGLVACMSDEERKALVKDRMTRIVQAGTDQAACVAGDKLLDRLEGKPAQTQQIQMSVDQRTTIGISSELIDRILLTKGAGLNAEEQRLLIADTRNDTAN